MRRDHAPLLIAAVALAVLPFVLDRIGLPLRTSIDVVLFAIACLGLERARRLHRPRLLRPRRLVRAWRLCGGALAEILVHRQHRPAGLLRRPFHRRHRGARRRADPAPARRLFLAPDACLDRTPVRDRLSLDGVHRRRERSRRGHARDRARPEPRARRDLLLGRCRRRLHRRLPALALPPLAGRQRPRRDPRERAARPLSRLSDEPLQAPRLRDLGDRRRHRRRALGVQPPLRLCRAARRRLLGRAHRHGGDRRHAELPRAGARGAVLHPVPRVPVDLDPELAVLFRHPLRRLHHVLADRPRRGCAAALDAVPQGDRGRSRDGRPHALGRAAAGLPHARRSCRGADP